MKVLSLDLASVTSGFSLIDTTDTTKVLACGKFTYTPKLLTNQYGPTRSAQLLFIVRTVESLIQQHAPDHVVIEDCFQGPNPATNKVLAQLSGAIVVLLESMAMPHEAVSPNEWRKIVGAKYQVKLKMKNRVACKAASKAFVLDRFGLSVTDDIADAILIGLIY